MDSTVSLRCKHCGAPLDEGQVRSDSSYVTCEYCGTSQQRIDAEKYMQDMVAEVKSWVLASMPSGYTPGTGDSVAKHAVFVKDIAPKLSSESNALMFGLSSLLGNCLIALPYFSSTFSSQHTSERVYAFAEKVKSVSELAGTQEDSDLIEKAGNIAQVYALILNNVRLMGEEKDGKWMIMAKNFAMASSVCSKVPAYNLVAKRFDGLSAVCSGFEYLLNGDITSSYGKIREGIGICESIKEDVLKNSTTAIMYAPMGQEISISHAAESILDFANRSGGNAVKMMQVIQAAVKNPPKPGAEWSRTISGSGRYDEIFRLISEAVASMGSGTIPIAAGPGDYLIPMWEADLTYTFVTGKLWAKKSVEVKEDILICADFPIDPECLKDPENALTDIFSIVPPSSIMSGWTGSKTSISSSEGVGTIQDSVADGTPSGRKLLVPLSGKREAEKLCLEYIRRKAGSDKNFRLSEPRVRRLIYVPFSLDGGKLVNESFGQLLPKRMEKIDVNSEFIIG